MRFRNRVRSLGNPAGLAAFAAFGLLLLGPATTRADVVSGTSTGYGVYANLNLLNTNLLTLGPAGSRSGTAPAPYNNTGAPFAGVSASVPLLLNLSTGVINSSASSNVDGTAGPRQATATGGVDGTSLSLVPNAPPILPSVLTLSATTLSSTSTVSGDYGVLVPTGSSTIVGLTVSVLGANITIPGTIGPNTGIAIGLVVGLSIILNEQIVTTVGSGQTKIETNAVAIRLNGLNVAGLGLVSGEILLGHSEAFMQAQAAPPPAGVPEPSTLALLGIGGGMMLIGRRRWRGRATG